MKKKLKWIGIAIIILILVALVLEFVIEYNQSETIIIEEENNIPIYDGPTNLTEVIQSSDDSNFMITPRNFNEAMKAYEGQVSLGELKRKFYKLIVKDIPKIYEETKTLTDEQIQNYYEQNTSKINDMNIYHKNEFISICNEIKKNVTEDTKSKIPNSSIELSTCEDTVDNYSFELRLEYSTNKIIELKVKISKNENKIEYENYDELKEVYLAYSGAVTKQEVINHLQYVGINAQNVYNSCKDLSLNKILQFYDLNKTAVNRLGIYSNRDYLKATNQIVRIAFRNNPNYLGFTVKEDTIKSDEKYTSFEAHLNYSTNESLRLIINIINSLGYVNEENPKLKITADIND